MASLVPTYQAPIVWQFSLTVRDLQEEATDWTVPFVKSCTYDGWHVPLLQRLYLDDNLSLQRSGDPPGIFQKPVQYQLHPFETLEYRHQFNHRWFVAVIDLPLWFSIFFPSSRYELLLSKLLRNLLAFVQLLVSSSISCSTAWTSIWDVGLPSEQLSHRQNQWPYRGKLRLHGILDRIINCCAFKNCLARWHCGVFHKSRIPWRILKVSADGALTFTSLKRRARAAFFKMVLRQGYSSWVDC